jgi:hypothetical protein
MINAASAFAIFQEINIDSTVTPTSVYWTALDAEREGHITVAEMDAIAIYHKAEIVKLYRDEQDYIEWEAKEMADVHQAQSEYWRDFEAGTL